MTEILLCLYKQIVSYNRTKTKQTAIFLRSHGWFSQARSHICDQACENQPCEHKNLWFFPSLLYHNLRTVCTNTNSLSLLQNLMGFLLFYGNLNSNWWKWDITFKVEDIVENITWCNLRSHGWFSQARSHIAFIYSIYVTGFEKSHLPCTITNL